MDSFIEERLDHYVKLWDEISEKTNNEQVTAAILHELCKDRRSEQIKAEREERKNSNGDGVTFKQKRFMKKLGIEFPKDITRREASTLIDEELERLNEAE